MGSGDPGSLLRSGSSISIPFSISAVVDKRRIPYHCRCRLDARWGEEIDQRGLLQLMMMGGLGLSQVLEL